MAVDLELMEEGIKPLPATEGELEAMDELGPGDYEIYSEMLTIIAQEAKDIMTKMGISAMLHSGDSVAAIYTAAGRPGHRRPRHVPPLRDRPDPHQVHPQVLEGQPHGGGPSRGRLLLQRGHLRRHPQPRPVRRGPRVPRRRADRLGGGRGASGRDRRQRAGRRGRHRPVPARRGDEADADQDRRALPAPGRPAEDDGELHLPGPADAGHRRPGQGIGRRPDPDAYGGAGRQARTEVPAGPVPEDDQRDRRWRPEPDRRVERRRLPARRVPGHHGLRCRAHPGSAGAHQEGRAHHHRPVRHLARARGELPGPGRLDPGPLRGEPVLVPRSTTSPSRRGCSSRSTSSSRTGRSWTRTPRRPSPARRWPPRPCSPSWR